VDELDYNDPGAVRAAYFCPCCGARQQTTVDTICIDCATQKHVIQACGCSTCRLCFEHLPEDRLAQLIDLAYREHSAFNDMLLTAGMVGY
jgi:hypothetical protein